MVQKEDPRNNDGWGLLRAVILRNRHHDLKRCFSMEAWWEGTRRPRATREKKEGLSKKGELETWEKSDLPSINTVLRVVGSDQKGGYQEGDAGPHKGPSHTEAGRHLQELIT